MSLSDEQRAYLLNYSCKAHHPAGHLTAENESASSGSPATATICNNADPLNPKFDPADIGGRSSLGEIKLSS